MVEAFPPVSSAEQQLSPNVNVLVNAILPERRSYTVDNITVPDFDAIDPGFKEFRATQKLSPDYVINRGEDGQLFAAGRVSGSDAEVGGFEGDDTLKAWLLESVAEVGIPLDYDGLRISLLRFQQTPEEVREDREARKKREEDGIPYTPLHIDAWLGALVYFKDITTVVPDESIQDVFPTGSADETKKARKGFSTKEVMDMIGEPVENLESYLRRPNPGQTLYVASEALHGEPEVPEGQGRDGIIAFIRPGSLKWQIG